MAPESGDLVLVDSVEPKLVSQPVGNADEPAETVGQRTVEVEDDQLESQGTLSVWGLERLDGRREDGNANSTSARATGIGAGDGPCESNHGVLADKLPGD